MTVEQVIEMVKALPPEKLEKAGEMIRGLAGSAARPAVSPEERRARVDAFAGRYAGAHSTVDEFLRRKREEAAIEDEVLARRVRGHP